MSLNAVKESLPIKVILLACLVVFIISHSVSVFSSTPFTHSWVYIWLEVILFLAQKASHKIKNKISQNIGDFDEISFFKLIIWFY